MQIITNFEQANMALDQFIPPRKEVGNYSLDRMENLMNFLGNPQNNTKIIHVAGTSGKTSTCYYIAALLKEAGFKVGLTVSPHIEEINERVQINLVPLPEKEFCEELSEFLYLIEKSGVTPSHYEALIAFAYWIFNKLKVDYAVIEVGLGGLLDGTNVIDNPNKICVITDIGIDHIKILGETIAEIAFQKAGIVQKNNTAFIHYQTDEIIDIVKNRCQKQNSELHIIPTNMIINDVNLSSLPMFQIRNITLAIQVVNYATIRDANRLLSSEQIQNASNVFIPARMEVVPYHGKQIILDGSHNEQKINALVEAMQQRFPSSQITMLVGFGHSEMSNMLKKLKSLRKLGDTIIFTKFDKAQDEIRISIEPEELAVFAKEAGFEIIFKEPNLEIAMKLLEEKTDNVGLVTGSFYLMQQVRPIVTKK